MIKKADSLLNATLVIQIIFFLSLVTSFIFQVNFPRIVIGMIYLTFVPGALILRYILIQQDKINLELDEFMLYSIGISFPFIAFIGLLDNIVVSLTKFSLKPFSPWILIATTQIFVFTFWVLNYISRRQPYLQVSTSEHILRKSVIAGLFLPLLTIIGMYFINKYNNNTIALLVIVFIVIYLVCTMYTKNYFFALWTMAISLLYLNSLLGCYFRPTDNIVEIGVISQILKNGFWNPTLPTNINSMINVVIVLPVYSVICSVNIIYIFRYVVPLFASLLPLGLYTSIRKIFSKEVAFLSCIFFISMYEYYTWLGLTMKMVTASFFLILVVLLLNIKKLSTFNAILLIVFLISLSTSHYGTSYIFMFGIVGAFLFNYISSKVKNSTNLGQILNATIVLLYVIFTISWYIYISSSLPYKDMATVYKRVIVDLLNRRILTKHSYSYQLIKGRLPKYLQILKYLYFISAIFIIIGLLDTMLRRKFKDHIEYLVISTLFLLTGGSIFLGGLSGVATPDRIYQIICLLLSPFCITGCLRSIDCILHFKIFSKNADIKKISYIFVILYLIVFLLFNTCFIAEVVYKYNVGPVISISKPRITEKGSLREKEYLDRVSLSLVNVKSAEWLWQYIGTYRLYCDRNSRKNFAIAGAISKINFNRNISRNKKLHIIRLINKLICRRSYVYFSSFNTETKEVKITSGVFPTFINLKQITKIHVSDKIYTNSKSNIYYYP